jgi:predicted dehydrogenase
MTKKEGTIKFAIIGAGHIGLRHAEMIAQQEEAELIAMCDIKSREALGLQHEVPFYQTPEELLAEHPDVEVVCVASPNGLHVTHALLALEAGKHVVLEKPIALSKAGAEQVIYTALHHSKYVFGVMQNRYSPPSVWIKELIKSKKLGALYMVQINCYWNRDERYYTTDTWHGSKELDGGTLFTQFSHFIDIMYWLFGDVENIQARLRDFNHQELTEFEDSGIVSFDFVQGGMGVLSYSTSCWDKNFESSITILAEKGTVKIGGQYMNEVEYCHVQDYSMPELPPANPPNDYGPYKGSAANHSYLIKNVVDVLKARDTITTNVLEGLKVVEIIERIYKAAKL